MRLLLLLLLTLNLAACVDELSVEKSKVYEPVLIVFELTVINKDKNTKQTTTIQQRYTIKEWESAYRPLTLLELKGYGPKGYIQALPVTIVIQTL